MKKEYIQKFVSSHPDLVKLIEEYETIVREKRETEERLLSILEERYREVFREELEVLEVFSKRVHPVDTDEIKERFENVLTVHLKEVRKTVENRLKKRFEDYNRLRELRRDYRYYLDKILRIYRENKEDKIVKRTVLSTDKKEKTIVLDYRKIVEETDKELRQILIQLIELERLYSMKYVEILRRVVSSITTDQIRENIKSLNDTVFAQTVLPRHIKRSDEVSQYSSLIPTSYVDIPSFLEELVPIGFSHPLIEKIEGIKIDYEGIIKGGTLGLKHTTFSLKDLLDGITLKPPVPVDRRLEDYYYSIPVSVRERLLLLEEIDEDIVNHKFNIIKEPFLYEFKGVKETVRGRKYYQFKRIFKERRGRMIIHVTVRLKKSPVLSLYMNYLIEEILKEDESKTAVIEEIKKELVNKTIDEQERIILTRLVPLYREILKHDPLPLLYKYRVPVLTIETVFHGTHPKVPGIIIKYMKKYYRKQIKDEETLRVFNEYLNKLSTRDSIVVEIIINGEKLESPWYYIIEDVYKHFRKMVREKIKRLEKRLEMTTNEGEKKEIIERIERLKDSLKKITPTLQNKYWWVLPLEEPQKKIHFGHQGLLLMKRKEVEEFVRQLKKMRKQMKKVGKTIFIKREDPDYYDSTYQYLLLSRRGIPFHHVIVSSEPFEVTKIDLIDEYVYIIDTIDKTKNVLFTVMSLNHQEYKYIDVLKKNNEVLVVRHVDPDTVDDEERIEKVLSRPLSSYLVQVRSFSV